MGRVVLLGGLLSVVGVIALSTPAASESRAQFGPEQIRNYAVDVHIESTGLVRVHEVIDYDFGVIPKHGIFRDIPVRFDYPPKSNHDRVYPLNVESVKASEGTPAQYTIESGDVDGVGLKRIKIADCTHTQIQPRAAITDVLGLPAGAVRPPKPILEERFNLGTAFSITPVTAGLGGALLLVVILVFAFLMYRFGRDRRYRGSAVDQAYGSDSGADEIVPVLHHEKTPVEFVPPDKLRPGQLGTLVDFTANPLDVTATIVDLAVRGYLVIEEIPGEGGFLHKPDWKLTKKKEPDAELKDYEQKLLNGLFEGGNEVQLSDLRYTFHTKMAEVQGALLQDAIDHGWFVHPPARSRAQWGCLGVLVLLAGAGLLTLLILFTHAALLGIPLLAAGILFTFGACWSPQRTAKGTAVLRHTEGFRRFINESEKERARFAERKNLFSEYLPYAIVFGATGKWAAAFAGLDDQPPDTSSWYIASTPFTFLAFSSAIDGFTVSTSGTLTSTPPSTSGSSGFSGGGFSGGGAGGGGGGSW